eukprot:TRINITY_DN70947_c1_g1_i1.p1 TRINITY_DN70947_c1_g1~~TRINITY_DN70947_c1_g1_i1.p1  ORF type:complete len:351 (+),score=11.20 TRINITY_DN70947_c1_g1_i1:560-1612(+)
MGGRPASAIKESGAPGPGAYDTKVAKEKIGARFGKDSRKPLSQSFNQFVPGPGAYESVSSAAKRYGGHQYTYVESIQQRDRFGQKLSSGKAEAAAPGPGAYNTKSTIGAGGVKPSISGRRPDTAASYSSYVPGPGAYSPSAPKGGMPAYRVGTAQRTRHDKEAGFVPGPGAYNPMDKIAKSTTPGWGQQLHVTVIEWDQANEVDWHKLPILQDLEAINRPEKLVKDPNTVLDPKLLQQFEMKFLVQANTVQRRTLLVQDRQLQRWEKDNAEQVSPDLKKCQVLERILSPAQLREGQHLALALANPSSIPATFLDQVRIRYQAQYPICQTMQFHRKARNSSTFKLLTTFID